MSLYHSQPSPQPLPPPRGRRIYKSVAVRAIREAIGAHGPLNVEKALAADFPGVRWPLDLATLIERERLYHRLNEIGW
jgi:hypothetical protein